MPQTGFSLPPAYLAQQNNAPDDVWIKTWGLPSEALRRLQERGLNSVELRAVRPGMEPSLVKTALDVVTGLNLNFSVHGLLPPSEEQTATVEGFPLWELVDYVREKQGTVMIPLHAKSCAVGELEPMIVKTVSALRRLLDECERRRAPFHFALEINRVKAAVDPSYTWEGVSAIVEEVDHPALGICWDFGHAFYNYHSGLIPLEPPVAFLKQVVHTHIHDVNSQYRTHWPLREGVVPIARNCELLHSAGYTGVYNLELDPPRYPDYPNLPNALLDSVTALRHITQNYGQ